MPQDLETQAYQTETTLDTGDATTDAPSPSTPAVMQPDIEAERAEMRHQLAAANARAERAEEEKSRLTKSNRHHNRKSKTMTVAMPFERRDVLAKLRGQPLTESIAKCGQRGVQHTGLVDFGPPPDGFRGIPAADSVSSPDLYIEYYLEKFGPEKTAKRLADKLHERVFKIRQHLVEEIEMVVFLVLLDRHGGDEEKAKREFIAMDRLPVYALDINENINDADVSEPAVTAQ